MEKETKERALRELMESLGQKELIWFSQPTIRDISEDLFHEKFRKELEWEKETLWCDRPDQIMRFNISGMAELLRENERYYNGFVGPRGGLHTEKREQRAAIILLRHGYQMQESLNREVLQRLRKDLERILEENQKNTQEREVALCRFETIFVEPRQRKLEVDQETLSDTGRMIPRRYLKPAFERLKRELAQPEGSIKTCADEMLPVLSKLIPGKSREKLEAFSRDAAVVKVMLKNLLEEYFYAE